MYKQCFSILEYKQRKQNKKNFPKTRFMKEYLRFSYPCFSMFLIINSRMGRDFVTDLLHKRLKLKLREHLSISLYLKRDHSRDFWRIRPRSLFELSFFQLKLTLKSCCTLAEYSSQYLTVSRFQFTYSTIL